MVKTQFLGIVNILSLINVVKSNFLMRIFHQQSFKNNFQIEAMMKHKSMMSMLLMIFFSQLFHWNSNCGHKFFFNAQ
jgi:hypothetical protein